MRNIIKIVLLLLFVIQSLVANEIGTPFVPLYHSTVGLNPVIAIFSPDGKYIASGGYNKLIIWETKSGKVLHVIEEQISNISGLAFSLDGKQLLSKGEDSIILWDTKTWKTVKIFSKNTKMLLNNFNRIQNNDKIEISEELQNKMEKEIEKRGEYEFYNTLLFASMSEDSKYIIAMHYNPRQEETPKSLLRLWDAHSMKPLRNFESNVASISSMTLDPNIGDIVISNGERPAVWKPENGIQINSYSKYSKNCYMVKYNKDGTKIAIQDKEDIKIIDIPNNKVIRIIPEKRNASTSSINFSSDDKFLYIFSSISRYAWFDIFDIEKNINVAHFSGLSENISGLTLMSNDEILLLFNGNDGKRGAIEIWDFKSLWKQTCDAGYKDECFAGDYSIHEFISNTKISKANEIFSLKSCGSDCTEWFVKNIASLDRKYLAFSLIDDSKDSYKVKILNINNSKIITLLQSSSRIKSITFTPDNKYILITNHDSIVMFDLKTREKVRTIYGNFSEVIDTLSSPNMKSIYTAHSDGVVRIWDISTGKELLSMVSFTDGEWISITPEGYFNVSKNGAKYLNVLTGPMSVTSIDTYYETFYRPDIVKSALAMRDIKPAPEVTIINTPLHK